MPVDFESEPITEDEDPFGKRPYKVGYGKPPAEHRFKQGNKAAAGPRAKKSKSARNAIAEALNERVTVVIKGKRKRMTQAQALARLVVAKSAQSVSDAVRLLKFALEMEPDITLEPSEIPKIEVSFVHRDWSDNPLPGHEHWLREQERRREEGEE